MKLNQRNVVPGLIVLSALILVFANSFGPGLTHDSAYYIDLSTKSGASFFAPQKLYSLLLSFFDPYQLEGARLINLICLLVTLCVWGRLFISARLDDRSSILFFAFLATGIPLITVSAFIWTEILFVCVTSVGIWAWVEWNKTRKWGWLILLVICSLLSIWARKIGIIFMVAAAFTIVSDFLNTRRQKGLSFIFFVLLLFGYWLLFYVGEKPEAQYVWRNFVFNVNGLINWFISPSFPGLIMYVFLGAVLTFFVKARAIKHPANRFFIYNSCSIFLYGFLLKWSLLKRPIDTFLFFFRLLFFLPPVMRSSSIKRKGLPGICLRELCCFSFCLAL